MVEAKRQSQSPGKPLAAEWTWADVLADLKGRVPERIYCSYFLQFTFVSAGVDGITLGSKFEHTRDVVLSDHLAQLEESVQKISGGVARRVSFITGEKFPWHEPPGESLTDAVTPTKTIAAEVPPPVAPVLIGPKAATAEAFAKMTAIDPLNLVPSCGDMTRVAIPMVRHWLFAPDKSKRQTPSFTVETKHKGKRVVQTVRIGDFNAAPNKGYGVLTTRHQKALFAIQEIWQEQRGQMVAVGTNHHGFIATTSWQLEDRIYGTHGGKQSAMVRQLLQELASIPLAITNYIDADGTVSDIDMTGLLSGVNFRSPKGKTQTKKGGVWVEILLGAMLTRAFQLLALKPLALQVLNDLDGDVPPLLYPRLDYMLSQCDEVTFKLPTLVNALGLIGEIERKPSRRRTVFKKAAIALTGRPLSRAGCILRVEIAPGKAADGEDLLIATSVRN